MATIKTTYYIQSCPKCRAQLLKVSDKTIGSPILTCYSCGHISRTDLRSEWYNYPKKNQIWIAPVITPVIMLVVGVIVGKSMIMGIIAALVGLCFSLCMTINYTCKILASKKRMRSASYLNLLRQYGKITDEEYESFMRDAE